MFGTELRTHDERYEMAEEWLGIVKRLWTEDEEFDHEGKYYKIQKGYLQPKPVQKPFPAADECRRVGTRHALRMQVLRSDLHRAALIRIRRLSAHIETYRKLAREEYGRDVKIWSLAYVVQADTEAAAHKFHDYYVKDKGDWGGSHALDTMGLNAKTFPPGV